MRSTQAKGSRVWQSDEEIYNTLLRSSAGSVAVIASLAAGVIEELLVVEGQRVRQGQPIARLLDTDSRIHADEARAAGQLQEAEVLAARGELESARLALENPVKLQAELAGAESALAEVEESVDTMGGLTFILAEQVPQVGASVQHPNGWTIEVIEGDETHVKRVRLHAPEDGWDDEE